MYTQFYGLREKPFSLSPDPRYLFLADSHREALAHLLYGIEQGEGFIAITGEVGTGKTTLCRTLLQRIEPGTEVSFIFNPQLSPLELLQGICAELGLEARSESRRELTENLNRFLLEKKAEGRRVLLIIDEAQNLSAETLEQIRLLSNLETDTSKLVQIILIGQPELDVLLESHELRQLRQRISVRWRLKPLSPTETRDYVRHRLRIAAGAPRDLFTELALREVHRRSNGVPRVVNLLCDRALLAGYAAGSRSIGLGIVTQTDREIRGGEEIQRFRDSAKAPPAWRRALPIAAVVVAALVGGFAWQGLRGDTLAPVAAAPPAEEGVDLRVPRPGAVPAPAPTPDATAVARNPVAANPKAADSVARVPAAPTPARALAAAQPTARIQISSGSESGSEPGSATATVESPVVFDPAAVTMAPAPQIAADASSRVSSAAPSVGRTAQAARAAADAGASALTSREALAPTASRAGNGRAAAPVAPTGRAAARPADRATAQKPMPRVGAPKPAPKPLAAVSARPPGAAPAAALAGDDLATALARTAPAAATAAALDALLARWKAPAHGAELLSIDEALAALGDKGLHALPLRGARVTALTHFDRPAFVELRARGGGERIVLLDRLDEKSAQITGLAGLGGRAPRSVPRAQFEESWTGDAWVVWRDFESLPAVLRSGQRGAPVAWLQHALGRLGFYKQASTGEYDGATIDAVQAFQASRRLRADGTVGPVTKMALYDALGRYGAPQLSTGGRG